MLHRPLPRRLPRPALAFIQYRCQPASQPGQTSQACQPGQLGFPGTCTQNVVFIFAVFEAFRMPEVREVLRTLAAFQVLEVLHMLEVLQMLQSFESVEMIQMIWTPPPLGGMCVSPAGRGLESGSWAGWFVCLVCPGPR